MGLFSKSLRWPRLATALAALTVLGAAAPANAWTTINWNGTQIWAAPWTSTTSLNFKSTDLGLYDTIYFNGLTDDYHSHLIPLPGLAATVTLTLQHVSTDKKTWTFDYSIFNASKSPVTSSRVSVFGFDVNPDVKSASDTGVFTNIGYNGNVPILQETADVCLSNKSGNGNCSGGGSGGVTIGNTGGGQFNLVFASATNQLSFTDPFVRYQSLSAPSAGVNSSSGVGAPVAWVPEPAAWALMLVGFGGIGAVLRRNRRGAQFACA